MGAHINKWTQEEINKAFTISRDNFDLSSKALYDLFEKEFPHKERSTFTYITAKYVQPRLFSLIKAGRAALYDQSGSRVKENTEIENSINNDLVASDTLGHDVKRKMVIGVSGTLEFEGGIKISGRFNVVGDFEIQSLMK